MLRRPARAESHDVHSLHCNVSVIDVSRSSHEAPIAHIIVTRDGMRRSSLSVRSEGGRGLHLISFLLADLD